MLVLTCFDMTCVGEVLGVAKLHVTVLDAVAGMLSVLLCGLQVHISLSWLWDNDLLSALIPESYSDFLCKRLF